MGIAATFEAARSAVGRGLLCLAAAAILGSVGPAEDASGQGEVVVRGAYSGTHLRLWASGDRLVVGGLMARSRPAGCRFRQRRLLAVCPLGNVGSIVLVLGPSGDMVEVVEKLPRPLTVHLGDGSDKFVGNGERDTCYSEGARRNRCIGGPGDDVCITGQQNSDCVGGGGDDYCQTGAGSDGCWGGPGDDVCRMGPGHDGCHGEGGHDALFGGSSSDRLYGGGGIDRCDGLPGRGRSEGCERGPRR